MQVLINRPDLEQFVVAKIQSGEYATADEVVENALQTLRIQEPALPAGTELRRLIAEGKAAADRGELLDGEEVFDKLLARNAARPQTP